MMRNIAIRDVTYKYIATCDRGYESYYLMMLASHSGKDEFSLSSLRDLYHLRWGIETTFRQLKYYDGISYSNTKKKEAAIGEIILALIFHNICTAVVIAFGNNRFKRKYIYKVSYSDLSDAIRLYISGRDPTITEKKIVKELERTLQAERVDRSYHRFLSKRSFRYFSYKAA